MKMNCDIEKQTLSLASQLMAVCHENTKDGATAIAALKIAREVIGSGIGVSVTSQEEVCESCPTGSQSA